jgi:hypothetical protein
MAQNRLWWKANLRWRGLAVIAMQIPAPSPRAILFQIDDATVIFLAIGMG